MNDLEDLPRPTREAFQAVHRLRHRYDALTAQQARDAAAALLADVDLADEARERLLGIIEDPQRPEAPPSAGPELDGATGPPEEGAEDAS